MGGSGPSREERNAAQAQANMSNQLAGVFNRQQDFFEKQQQRANPFFISRMEGGLPYYNAFTDAQSGLNARAFAPAEQALSQRLSSFGSLPSGYAEQARTDLAAQKARAFDDQLLNGLQQNEAAKQYGAAGVSGQQQLANPLGYASGSMNANSSILGAGQNLRNSSGIGGLLGGMAGGALSFF